jgi:hypothetical protein
MAADEVKSGQPDVDHGQVPFPVITTFSHTIVLQFSDPQDRDLFKRWLTGGDGWAAFGTYVDERRG